MDPLIPAGESKMESRIERWWAATWWGAARLAYRFSPRLTAASLEIDGGSLHARAIPCLFSSDLRQIDPTLNDDLLELYGRSNAVLENHFAFFHRSQKFEAAINWDPPESPAWRKELHAFDYALDVALTYRISCEDAYARHLRYLVAHWIASNPPARGAGWLPGTVARRVRNWILAADLARADWERDREFLSIVSKSLALQTSFLLRHATALSPAAETLEGSRALLLASRFFEGGKASEMRASALGLLLEEFDARLRLCGRYVESSPAAQLHLATTLMEWLLFDAETLEPSLEGTLRQSLLSIENMLLPGGALPLFGPSGRACEDELADLAGLAAVRLHEASWKTLAGNFRILPYMLLGEPGKSSFARLSGAPCKAESYFEPRSEFHRLSGSDSSALIVTAHCPTLPEDHRDFLSFELSVQGHRVVVDSGGYTPEDDEYFSSARAHNILLIDGQPPVNAELPSLPANPWISQPGYVRLKLADQGFASRGLKHERGWFCLDGRVWVVLDKLEGHGSHHCVSLVHFYPTFEIQLREPKALARSRACQVTLIPLGQHDAKMSVSRGDHAEYPGWYSPEFGIKYLSSVLAIEWTHVELPWTGGFLIVPGADAEFRPRDTTPGRSEIAFELAGKAYTLHLEQ